MGVVPPVQFPAPLHTWPRQPHPHLQHPAASTLQFMGLIVSEPSGWLRDSVMALAFSDNGVEFTG